MSALVPTAAVVALLRGIVLIGGRTGRDQGWVPVGGLSPPSLQDGVVGAGTGFGVTWIIRIQVGIESDIIRIAVTKGQ